MPSRLTDNLNSSYISAANRLKPHGGKRRIVAYVESYDDVFFWRSVLNEYEDETRYFEVMLPSRTTLGKGKKLALMNRLGHGLGQDMIACVDADYDYLLQGNTDVSQRVCHDPYVFHTYAYAIENLQCYAPTLHQTCVMATLNDREILDLEAFLEEYSRIIYPLLVWNVWAYRYDSYKQFSLLDFADTVTFRDVNLYRPEDTLEYIRRRVNKRISWAQRTFPQGRKTYAPLRSQLEELGVTPETAYLYMRGHTLMEGVILPLLGPVCTLLRREREKDIKRYAEHQVQQQNELSCYQHSQAPLEEMLRKGTAFHRCPCYKQILCDIERFLEPEDVQTPVASSESSEG